MGPWAAKQDAQVLSRCVLHFTSLLLWGELSKARSKPRIGRVQQLLLLWLFSPGVPVE